MWTLYLLELPDIDILYGDMKKAAKINLDLNPEVYFSLLCEGHLWLRLFINSHPEWEQSYLPEFKETCRKIGLEHLKNSWIDASETDSLSTYTQDTDSLLPYATTSYTTLPIEAKSGASFDTVNANFSEDVVDTGVTFLRMGDFTLSKLFHSENEMYLKDGKYIHGFVRLIHTFLPDLAGSNSEGTNGNKLPPSLVPVLVDFLSNHAANLLVEFVIEIPLIREYNSTKLISVMNGHDNVLCCWI